MATQVTMPVLGLTMEEGTVAEWLKREGDSVAKDEPLLTVEMDKGTVEVPAPAGGVLRRIVVQPGTTVPVRTLIAEIDSGIEIRESGFDSGVGSQESGFDSGVGSQESGFGASSGVTTGRPRAGDVGGTAGQTRLPTPDSRILSGVTTGRPLAGDVGGPAGQTRLPTPDSRILSSPRARMRARAVGVDLGAIRGSGPHGRIVEADVLAAATTETRVTSTPLARRLAQEHGVALGDLRGSGPGGRVTQDDVLRAAQQPPKQDGLQPLSRVRRITAERMAASAQATARVSMFLEADLSEAARFRRQLQPEFERLGVAKLPWDAIIARAAGLALAEHPAVLAQWTDNRGLQMPETIDVGVAVALEPEGLVVPVLRAADRRSLRELAADLLVLVDKARAGRLTLDEMQGGAFSITNLGGYRIDGFTPIINPPETAILGVGRIAEKAVVIEGKLEARTMSTLSLSFDHRVVDGAPAAAFLSRLAELIERPYALLGI